MRCRCVVMYSLSIEAMTYSGESKDDTIEIPDTDESEFELNIRAAVHNFVSDMYDDGYSDFYPSHYQDFSVNELLQKGNLLLNENLSLVLEKIDV